MPVSTIPVAVQEKSHTLRSPFLSFEAFIGGLKGAIDLGNSSTFTFFHGQLSTGAR